mgnify:CR=1 FL=1
MLWLGEGRAKWFAIGATIAIVAVIIFKIFGEQGLWVLGMTCAVTVLRTAHNINEVIGCLFVNEEEEN